MREASPSIPDEVDEEGLRKHGYDAVICGTGLEQSILASALSLSGMSVLHVDGAARYGELDASLTLHELGRWAFETPRWNEAGDDGGDGGDDSDNDNSGEAAVDLKARLSLSSTFVHRSSNVDAWDSDVHLAVPGTRVVTPFGHGVVRAVADHSKPDAEDISGTNNTNNNNTNSKSSGGSMAIELTSWTLFDNSRPMLYIPIALPSPSSLTFHIKKKYRIQSLLSHYYSNAQSTELSKHFAIDLKSPNLLFATTPTFVIPTTTGSSGGGGGRTTSANKPLTNCENRDTTNAAAASAVQGLVSSGVADYLEFKSMESLLILMESSSSTFVHKATTNVLLDLIPVPCSKSHVFQSKLLLSNPLEKRKLMKVLQLASDFGDVVMSSSSSYLSNTSNTNSNSATAREDGNGNNPSLTIQQHDPTINQVNENRIHTQGMSLVRPQNKSFSPDTSLPLSPSQSCSSPLSLLLSNTRRDYSNMSFSSYLQTVHGLSLRLCHVVIHALALIPTAQSPDEPEEKEGVDGAGNTWSSIQQGMLLLYRHLYALGRYGQTAFITTLYGGGELAQAFCRSSAVHGGTYMLRRCPRQIIIDQANDNKVCAVVLDTAGDNNDDDNSLSMKINSKSDFKEDGALRKRIQCKHVVVSADALVTQRRNKSCQSDCSVRTTRIIRRIGIVKGQILWNSDDNGHNQQQQQQQILPQQRSLIIIPPNTPLIQNINVVFGVVMDHGASVCPVGYTVVHLSTVISANDHDEDSKVLDRAMEALVSVSSRRYRHFRNQARDAKLYGIEQGEAMELYYVTFSYAVGRGSRSLNLKRNAAAEDDTSSSISGCHIIDRPTLNVTLDDAFQRAKDIFNDIVKAQHRGMRNGKEEPAPAFLKISPKLKEIVDSCRRDSGQNAVDDDDEAEFLESAVNLMKETSPQVDGI